MYLGVPRTRFKAFSLRDSGEIRTAFLEMGEVLEDALVFIKHINHPSST